MPAPPEADVIGAGVIGRAIATEMSRRGHRTLNVEPGPAAGRSRFRENWADHIGDLDGSPFAPFRRCGMLVMSSDGNAFARRVVGVDDVGDDGMPIDGRTDLDAFSVAIGSSGNQFKHAGAAGQIMGDLIEAGHAHDADPLRTSCRFMRRPIDIGAFSPNRSLNTSSSMSVRG